MTSHPFPLRKSIWRQKFQRNVYIKEDCILSSSIEGNLGKWSILLSMRFWDNLEIPVPFYYCCRCSYNTSHKNGNKKLDKGREFITLLKKLTLYHLLFCNNVCEDWQYPLICLAYYILSKKKKKRCFLNVFLSSSLAELNLKFKKCKII